MFGSGDLQINVINYNAPFHMVSKTLTIKNGLIV